MTLGYWKGTSLWLWSTSPASKSGKVGPGGRFPLALTTKKAVEDHTMTYKTINKIGTVSKMLRDCPLDLPGPKRLHPEGDRLQIC